MFLGDPDSKYMTVDERSLVLSRYVQEKLVTDYCYDEWREWRRCVKNHSKRWFPFLYCKTFLKIANECEVKYVFFNKTDYYYYYY